MSETTAAKPSRNSAATDPQHEIRRPRLTDRTVRELASPASGNRVIYDPEMPGFGIRLTAGGARSFILNYRTAGRERRLTIGSVPAWNVAAARKRAAALRQQIDRGEDPLAIRDEIRTGSTVADLWAVFAADHLGQRRPSTQAEYSRQAKQQILPRFGRLRVASITREDIAGLHREIAREHPYAANRVLALLSVLFNLAIEKKLRPDNPCARISKAPEEKRETFLKPDEIGRLVEALDKHPEKISAAAIKLMLLTGCRRGEALHATWGEFDLAAGIWSKPRTHTKQKKPHRIPISAAAVAVLREMEAEAERRRRDGILTPYVFVSSKKPAEGLLEVRRTWASACNAAGLHGVRLHDLRHSFASALVSGGVGLPTIGAMLGHSQPRTTARYSHVYDDTLRKAAERVGAMVVPLPGRRA